MSEVASEQVVDETVDTDAAVSDAPEPDSPESVGAASDSPESVEGVSLTADEIQQQIAEARQQAVAEAEQRLAAQLANAFGMGQQQQAAPEIPDPFDENYAEKMQAYLEYRDQQVIAQQQQLLAPIAQQQTIEQVNNAVANAAKTHGIDTSNEAELERVNRFGAAFFHDAQGDLNRATDMGARFYKELRDEITSQVRKEQLQQISEIDGAPAEPGVGGGAVSIESGPRSYGDATSRFLSRARASE